MNDPFFSEGVKQSFRESLNPRLRVERIKANVAAQEAEREKVAADLRDAALVADGRTPPQCEEPKSKTTAWLEGLTAKQREALENQLLGVMHQNGELSAETVTSGFGPDGAYPAPDDDEEVEW